jgi:hypothetical protein
MDLIHPSSDPADMAFARLVSHGVGQGLDGSGAVDAVAIEVEEGVQLGQAQPAVAGQDGDA